MSQNDFNSMKKIKTENKGAFTTWSREDDDELINLFLDGVAVGDMAVKLNRSKGAIRARIRKMELTQIKKKSAASLPVSKR